MRYLLCSLATLMTALAACQALAGGEDFKKLEGAWEVTELIIGGTKVPAKDIAGMKFVFAREKNKDDAVDKLTIVPAAADTGVVEKHSFTIKINAAKKPAEVNLTALDGEFKGTTSPGIYEINGDVLRWCQSDDPKTAERPKTFNSPEKSSIYMFTFKRAKK